MVKGGDSTCGERVELGEKMVIAGIPHSSGFKGSDKKVIGSTKL